MRVERGTTSRTRTLALLAATLLMTLLGCESDGGGGKTTDGHSPFTGAPAQPRPVLAVKIDNVAAARPQTGVDRADIVYVEQVEGGLSRMLGIFSTQLPDTVGPVRSARETDLELLRQFGRPALAYSGVQSKLQPSIDRAPLYPLPPGRVPQAYERSRDRAAPHNLYVRPATALRAAPHASDAKDIGFRFGAAPAEGGRPTSRQTVHYPAADFAFTWSGERGRWLVSMDGSPATTTDGERLAAGTVVVQYVNVTPSRFHDKFGNVSPFTETTGSGSALVLRDGKAFQAHWERPTASDGTEFTAPDGKRLAFATGQVWVVYAAR
ncbi:CchlO [Streptomyces albus subsp. albus]|nr:CchlO [Streptomyces albus subsp. albus]